MTEPNAEATAMVAVARRHPAFAELAEKVGGFDPARGRVPWAALAELAERPEHLAALAELFAIAFPDEEAGGCGSSASGAPWAPAGTPTGGPGGAGRPVRSARAGRPDRSARRLLGDRGSGPASQQRHHLPRSGPAACRPCPGCDGTGRLRRCSPRVPRRLTS